MNQWELVHERKDGNQVMDITERLRVVGGWIYRTTRGVVFVPDLSHCEKADEEYFRSGARYPGQ